MEPENIQALVQMMFFFKGDDVQVQKPFVFQSVLTVRQNKTLPVESELAWNPKIGPLSL